VSSTRQAEALVAPALRTEQGSIAVYLLFLRGKDLLSIADIHRASRGKKQNLDGFQRKEIRDHVNEIARYLDNGGTLFPNAIILALEPNLKFDQSRGKKPKDTPEDVSPGRLVLPVRPQGQRAAWVVDGQQRSLALGKSKGRELIVPVVAFETASINVRREQFILVNRARPLPSRLIDELLPETKGVLLPRDLTARRLPSELCDALNTHEDSPLRGMIRRSSQEADSKRVVTDTAVLNMVRRSLNNPNGALAAFKSLSDRSSDATSMLSTLIDYWSAVRQVFPRAWGKPPSESRLMHSVGIAALGDLMDRIAARMTGPTHQRRFFAAELERIADTCAWTEGRWPSSERMWDEFQNTRTDIKLLSQTLVRLYAQRCRE
jgi:DGQHR domain-containing protein